MMRIAILDDSERAARQCADWSAIDRRAEVVVFEQPLGDSDAVARALADFDAVCLMVNERLSPPR